MIHVSLSGTFVQYSDVIINLHGAVLEKLITSQLVTKGQNCIIPCPLQTTTGSYPETHEFSVCRLALFLKIQATSSFQNAEVSQVAFKTLLIFTSYAVPMPRPFLLCYKTTHLILLDSLPNIEKYKSWIFNKSWLTVLSVETQLEELRENSQILLSCCREFFKSRLPCDRSLLFS